MATRTLDLNVLRASLEKGGIPDPQTRGSVLRPAKVEITFRGIDGWLMMLERLYSQRERMTAKERSLMYSMHEAREGWNIALSVRPVDPRLRRRRQQLRDSTLVRVTLPSADAARVADLVIAYAA